MSDATAGMIEARRPPPQAKQGWGLARATGFLLCALWGVFSLALLNSLVEGFDAEIFARYFPRMIDGLWITAKLVVLSVTIGGLLALPLALARMSENWLVSKLAFAYVYAFRGTPLLGQVFLLYYGAGQFVDQLQAAGLWWFFRDAYNCVLLTFILNTAAYQAEIFKTAIESIPRGQWEAAASLGLHKSTTFRKIILPQALITALRPLGNEVILMVKSSAVASLVTVFDLMGATKLAFSRTYDFNVYMWAAIIYLMIVETLRRVWAVLERRLTRHLVR